MTISPKHVALTGNLSPNPVIAAGDGSPVVFLHGPFGQEWPGFLEDLSATHRVFAPANPGAEEPADLELLDDLHDLVVYYDELFDELGLTEPFDLIGHSYGGLVAAEYAATYPRRIRKLVLIDSMGLWRDDQPVNEYVTVAPEVLQGQLWHDTTAPAVAARLAPSEDIAEAQAQFMKEYLSVASTAHFVFPIPERGLHKRLRRISSETLLIWGAEDGLVPSAYAQEFQSRIASSEVRLVQAAGHFPHVEQQEEVSRLVLDFLARTGGK
ncbi:alpha/beta fold hydrolase [Gordonia paraffinivorans]|uniref:alpha/beta fold hydrolase n=1 Tax=Gordonia paraffinivorans TaxID=175628 RepID=UPI001E51A60B|nr:alpha/beta hydrolase [Gordonia paraffinivorans]MCD2147411.1 alpha/beta hydrolase [Gordonia paraffinivorans]